MKINEFYDKLAPEYEKLLESPSVNAQLMKYVKEIFSKYKITGGRVLDIGCGPGNLKSTLGNSFSYTGIDVSDAMLLKAQEKGYEIMKGKVEEKVFEISDKTFDYIVAVGMLHFVKDISSILQEFQRMTRKGWLISLPDVPESYGEDFPIKEPIYNHTKIVLSDIQEDIYFPAWTSITTGERMNERMVFKKLS